MNNLSFRSIIGTFLVLMMSLVVLPAAGQGIRMSEEERKEAFEANFEELKAALALDEATAPKVKDLMWAQQEKQMELFASMRGSGGGSLARSGMRQKMTELREEMDKEMSAILSEEQMEAYQAFQAERRRGPRQGQGAGRTLPQ